MTAPDFALSLSEPQHVLRFRETLGRRGYDGPSILRLLGVSDFPTVRERRQSLPLCLHRTRAGTPLDTLVRLFTLQQSVSLDAARDAAAPTPLEDWAQMGLVRTGPRGVSAAVELCHAEGLIVAADWAALPDTRFDQVMTLAASSRTLAQMTIRRRVARALDLGTGCGIQALLAAAHSDRVVAVDSNPRASMFAEFNAQLNGVANVCCAAGNLFEPVSGQQFDLIVCNPPFVIGPHAFHMHTSAGQPSDQFCQTIVQTAPAYLTENGTCQVLCNWAQVAGENWQDRLGRWFHGSGCDAWVLHSHTEDAAGYALARANEIAEEPEQAAALFDEWMRYWDREQIEAVGFGLITLRRATKAENWVRYETLPGAKGACGPAIERGFALRDFLEAHREDRALLETRLCCAKNLSQQQNVAAGRRTGQIRIRIEDGLTYAAPLEAEVVDFVLGCQGDRPLSTHLAQLAAAKGLSVDRFAPGFLKVVRNLLAAGFLLPEEMGTAGG